jgi:hypothetical protein
LTTSIVLYLLFGAGFGLATFSKRHLFSEGPTQRDDAAATHGLKARLFGMLICTCLWPVMALTGLHSWWLLSRRRAQAKSERRD